MDGLFNLICDIRRIYAGVCVYELYMGRTVHVNMPKRVLFFIYLGFFN